MSDPACCWGTCFTAETAAVAFQLHRGCRVASGVRKPALQTQLHRGCQTRLSLGNVLYGSGDCTLATWRIYQVVPVVKNLALPQRQLHFCIRVDFRSHLSWKNLLCESGFANVRPGLIRRVAVRWQQQMRHFRRTAGTCYTTVAASLMPHGGCARSHFWGNCFMVAAAATAALWLLRTSLLMSSLTKCPVVDDDK